MLSYEKLLQTVKYNPETGIFYWLVGRNRGKPAGNKKPHQHTSYRRIAIDGKNYYCHRLALFYVTGRWPGQVDHLNRNGLDNRLSNLRECSHSENLRNCKLRTDNPSGHTGVRFKRDKKKWQAYINPGHWTHIGYYETFEDAVAARRAAERQYGFHENHGRVVA